MVAFETLMVNICPTTTPFLNESNKIPALTDSLIQREFTGTYAYGDGFGGAVLVIDCNNKFYLQESTDVGRFPLQEGFVKVENGRIILEGKNWDGKLFSLVYIPVRWGLRKYLIDEKSIDYFCEKTISTGFYKEPRGDDDFGVFFLRLHDDELEASDFPVFPSGFKVCT